MGLLDKLKERRQSNKVQAGFRKLDDIERHKRLKQDYDEAYEAAAKEAVRIRAARQAKERYGYTKRERRQRAIGNIVKEVSAMGDMMGGSSSSRRRSSSRQGHGKRHRSQSRSRPKSRRRENRDPFDFDIGDFNI